MRKLIYNGALIFIITVFFIVSVYADTALEVKVNVGYDKDNGTLYKIGYLTPVKIQIKNSFKDIKGEIQVEAVNSNKNITIYAKPLTMTKDSSKSFVLDVPLLTYNNDIKINIVEGNNPIYTKKARVSPGVGGDTLLIGFLSDDYESIRYIDKIPASNSAAGTNTVRLSGDTFPESKDLLGAFNLIVINNFDTSVLNTGQYEALKSWVEDGGTLLIGTGPLGSKALGVFKDDFIIGSTGASKQVSTYALHAMAGKAKGEVPFNIDILELDIKDGENILKEGNIVLAKKLQKGKGTVGICAFDFGLKPLTEWAANGSFSEALIDKLLPYWVKVNWSNDMKFERSLYTVKNALENIPELDMPKTRNLIIVFIIYILLAGPINYLVLKRIDRREYMWLTIPVLALIFAAVNYFMGITTRVNEPLANVISVVDIEQDGRHRDRIYAGIFNPQKADIKVEAEADMKIKPAVFNNFYHDVRISDKDYRPVDSKVILAPKTAVEFYDTGAWSMKIIEMELEKQRNGNLKTNFNCFDGKIKGTIENNTGYDLDELYIIAADQFAVLGAIKNGEAKSIDETLKSYYGNMYDLLNMIYKEPYEGSRFRQGNISDEQKRIYRLSHQKQQVWENYITGLDTAGGQLIGFSNMSAAKKIYVNNKAVRKFEKTFISAHPYISFTKDNVTEYPFGYIRPEVFSKSSGKENYDNLRNVYYGNGTIEVNYDIGKDIDVHEVSIRFDSSGNFKNSKNRIKQFMWDTESSGWTELKAQNMKIVGSDIKKYIDNENMLKLKFEVDETELPIPQISVKGSVKQ